MLILCFLPRPAAEHWTQVDTAPSLVVLCYGHTPLHWGTGQMLKCCLWNIPAYLGTGLAGSGSPGRDERLCCQLLAGGSLFTVKYCGRRCTTALLPGVMKMRSQQMDVGAERGVYARMWDGISSSLSLPSLMISLSIFHRVP